MMHDVIVVGAGVAGLSLARRLAALGYSPLVLDRARGVGGRCASRRVDGQPVDHGLPYLHGRTKRFLAEWERPNDAGVLENWPRVRVGDGTPCRPEAFEDGSRRVALAGGVNQFAKRLATGIEVRCDSNVVALERHAAGASGRDAAWELELGSGERLLARAVALALPAPSCVQLLESVQPPSARIAGVLPLIRLVRMLACLTVIARYPPATPAPHWEAAFPDASSPVHSILHDSSKRGPGARLTLVIQARPGWSRAQLAAPADTWADALLKSAAGLHGEWIARPEAMQAHVWRHARVDAGSELACPIALILEGGALLGLAGDGFHLMGGVEGAYWSGIELADRFVQLLDIRGA